MIARDRHWNDRIGPPPALGRAPTGSTRTSRYLSMRDGAHIAIDLHLPPGEPPRAGLPTIVRSTRYMRDVAVRRVLDVPAVRAQFDFIAPMRNRFLARGYAWVDVDARGSGASTGTRPHPWSPEEISDGYEVVDWITSQRWSNGRVGATGVSYDGTAADFLLASGHKAIRAIAPRFSLFDTYLDVAFPGGIHLAWFTDAWARFNRTLDGNDFHHAAAQALWIVLGTVVHGAPPGPRRAIARAVASMGEPRFVRALGGLLGLPLAGVRAVDDDPRHEAIERAVQEHRANASVHEYALKITHRDDANVSPADPTRTIDAFSPHAHLGAFRSSGAAIFSYSGWRDGGYPNSATKRFMNVRTGGSRLLLGPWNHGGRLYHPAFGTATPTAFDHDAEVLRFFDLHLRGIDDDAANEPAVRYYTMGEDRWHTTDVWPPPETQMQSWFFGENRSLLTSRPSSLDAFDRARTSPTTGSGPRSRWRGLIGAFIPADYPDRRSRESGALVYQSAPLAGALEVTGHGVVRMFVRSSAPDPFVFVYLEDVAPDGTIAYVTEGQLRLLHRQVTPAPDGYVLAVPFHSFRREHARPMGAGEVAEVQIELQPISWLFQRGHRLRLRVTGADADHFRAPPDGASQLDVFRNQAWASRIELPSRARDDL